MTAGAREAQLAGVYAALAGKAQRMTRQRRRIIEEFARLRRYTTAQDLHRLLRGVTPRIGLATIYRTLELLHAAGAATAATSSRGERAYLFCQVAHHHHAVCVRCGRVQDVPCRVGARFERALTGSLRFTLTQHRLELFGLCARCA